MKPVAIILSTLAAALVFASSAQAWSSPYYWYQESSFLFNNNVDGRCGSGTTVTCYKFKETGYPFGSTFSHTTPNCYGKDWDGDGDFHIREHNFEFKCWWGEWSPFPFDTRKCNGWYEVDGLSIGQIVRVYDGRSCSGDWDG